jgi:predicted Mrr-cat superfamily restriction endonuclease
LLDFGNRKQGHRTHLCYHEERLAQPLVKAEKKDDHGGKTRTDTASLLPGGQEHPEDCPGAGMFVEQHYPHAPQAAGRMTQQILNFVTTVANGDLVLAADGAMVLAIGRVAGPYTYDPSTDFPHQRPSASSN